MGRVVSAEADDQSRHSRGDRSPILGFLADAFQAGTDFLSRPIVLTLLLAIGLPGLVLLLLMVGLVDQPPIERGSPVATIARACDCVGHLGNGHTVLSAGMELVQGQRLTLRVGLVEIEFADVARIIRFMLKQSSHVRIPRIMILPGEHAV